MPDLKRVPAATATKAKQLAPRRARAKRAQGGWKDTMKVVFVLERPRRRPSSPSIRQIALIVVSGGLAIMVIRVVARRKGGDIDAQAAAAQPDTTQPDTAQPDTSQPDTAQPDTAQDSAETEGAQSDAAQSDGAQSDAAQSDGAQTEPAEADTAQAGTEPAEAHAGAGKAESTHAASANDTVTASESTLIDRVQSEMSRRDDAPAPATGAD